MISTRWILVLQLIRFTNDPQVQFFLNEPFLSSLELSSHFEDPCNIGARFGDSTRPQPARRSSASRANSCSSLSEGAPASWPAYGEKQGEHPARPAARTGAASRGCAQGRHREENSVADGCNYACSCYFRYRGVGHCWKSRTSENTKTNNTLLKFKLERCFEF
jgi:hypothetical protein